MSGMHQQNIQELIDKYLEGNCTSEEEERVHAWLEKVNRKDQQWSVWSAEEREAYLSTLYEDIRHSTTGKGKNLRRKKLRLYFTRIAASLILLAALSALLYRYGPGEPGIESPEGYVLEKTGTGGLKELRLNDGSVVWLNAASTFSYPEIFDDSIREVFLEGEAFFNIARDTSRPFIIHTAEMETRVLGTSFNVQAYREADNMRVTVVTGKVEVSVPSEGKTEKEKIYLQPKQMVTYARKGGDLTKKSVSDMEPYAAWKDGKLVFDHTSMSEVAATLERAFGLKIKIENPAILQCKITGRFDRSQAAELTVEAICKSVEARYTLENGKVVIDGEGCGNYPEIKSKTQ